MKREIKFRAWMSNDKEMLDPVDLNTMCILNCGLGISESAILMQYTGLKDKNGKEIYEGDVLKVDNGCNTVISWDNDGCRFIDNRDFDSDSFTYYDGFSSMSEYEVIGNIYENPELL